MRSKFAIRHRPGKRPDFVFAVLIVFVILLIGLVRAVDASDGPCWRRDWLSRSDCGLLTMRRSSWSGVIAAPAGSSCEIHGRCGGLFCDEAAALRYRERGKWRPSRGHQICEPTHRSQNAANASINSGRSRHAELCRASKLDVFRSFRYQSRRRRIGMGPIERRRDGEHGARHAHPQRRLRAHPSRRPQI